jgi:hypothetical protein
MKTLFASFGWLLLLLPIVSVAGSRTILNASGNNSGTEKRSVSNFTGISSSGAYDVFVKMGTTEDLRLEGDEDAIKNTETKVENGILKIRNIKSSGWNWTREKVRIYISAKTLNTLSVSGSGDMEVNGVIKATLLNTQVSGSGNIQLNVDASNFNAAISGSGGINASGSASVSNLAISGSGGFDGKNLKTDVTSVKVSGSGNATVSVEKELNAKLSGSGNIRYTGNPKVNQSKSGSGCVVRGCNLNCVK